jgi:hypothetical protein
MVGKVRGHVADAQRLEREERSQRKAVDQNSSNRLLSKRELQGEWDASRVLYTTLNGELRTITASDLDAFRKNMEVAQKSFKGGGITARQVLDLAASKPLKYKNPQKENAISDLDKAKREIKTAIAASAKNNDIRFITSAGTGSKVTRHYVTIRMNGMDGAIRQLSLIKSGDKAELKKVARWLRKQKLAFDCDCERHKYFFRYVATIGGFAAGRPETAYPKITNPKLQGVACKHVLRAMNEFDSSTVVLSFIERLLAGVHSSKNNRANVRLSEAEAKKQQKARKRVIKTSDDRKEEARRRRSINAAHRAVKQAERLQGRQPAATKRYKEALERGELTTDDLIAMLVNNGINPGK